MNGIFVLLNSIISNNSVSVSGGHPSSPLVMEGGGIYSSTSDTLRMTNGTSAFNSPEGIHEAGGVVSIKNSILFFNTPNQIVGVDSVAYCDVQSGYAGPGNINLNPVFASKRDLRIVPGSPCVDAGDPDSMYNDACFQSSLGMARNDMGAHGGPGACGWEVTVSPVLVSPANGSVANQANLSMVWRPSPTAESYRLQVATDTVFSSLAVNDSTIADTTRVVRNLADNQTYSWRVRARNVMGWGPFSESWQFTLRTTGIAGIQSVPSIFSLSQNHPNPFNPSTTIRYGLPQRSHVTLTVYNTLGQQIALLQNGEQEAGYHDVKLEGSGLSSGVYFYRMEAGLFVETRKLLLIR